MKLLKSRKVRVCKKCNDNIYINGYYYPQRHRKSLCFECGFVEKDNSKWLNLIAILLVIIAGLTWL